MSGGQVFRVRSIGLGSADLSEYFSLLYNEIRVKILLGDLLFKFKRQKKGVQMCKELLLFELQRLLSNNTSQITTALCFPLAIINKPPWNSNTSITVALTIWNYNKSLRFIHRKSLETKTMKEKLDCFADEDEDAEIKVWPKIFILKE